MMRKYVVVAALSAAMVLLGGDSAWARHRGCGGRRHHGGCGCSGGGGCYGGCGGGYGMGCGGGCGGGYAMGCGMGGYGMGGGMGYATLMPDGGTEWALDGQPTFFAPQGWVWSAPTYQQALPAEVVWQGEPQPISGVWIVSD